MAATNFQMTEMLGDCAVTIKNTFIHDLEPVDAHVEPRRKSVPASSRLCQPAHSSICTGKLLVDRLICEASDVSTDASACSESGTRTPMSSCMDDASPASCGFPQEMQWSLTPPPLPHVAPRPESTSQRLRLNAKAAAFQPQMVSQTAKEPIVERYSKHIAEVLRAAKQALQDSAHVVNVEISHDQNGWSVVIQPTGDSEEHMWKNELLLKTAKEALLEAASKSKSIYVMGYCGKDTFNMRAQGFEATLGAMRDAGSACWHIFKKGFCRHAADCSKQHPAFTVPVHVLVEGMQLNSCPRFADAFKQVVADLTQNVTSLLEESPYVEMVAAFKDGGYPGWTIEMTAKEELTAQNEEYLLTLAKNALFSASSDLEILYIMGYAVKPFTSKPHGFVTMIGDMQDESRVCWDMYSKGSCSRDCSCRWEHPECLMPINVVVKQHSSFDALAVSLISARKL